MTDSEIIKILAHHQARGLAGAAQARAFVEGRWIPQPNWDSICRALLVVAREVGLPARVKLEYTKDDCAMVLAALRKSDGRREASYHAVGPSTALPGGKPTG